MALTNGRMDVLSETGELIQAFSATLENGEQVAMEIRPSGDALNIGVALKGVLQELDETIDKSEIEQPTITNDRDRDLVANALIEDKREIGYVETKLDRFANIAFAVHRTITGERAKYSAYAKARAAKRDAAIVEYAKEQQQKIDAENARLREVARKDEEARRKAEAAELLRRAKKEKKPELAQRASEIKSAPIPEAAITTTGGSGGVNSRARGSSGGSVGLKPKWIVEVTDLDAFILAVARPYILREVVELMKKEHGPGAKRVNVTAMIEPILAKLSDCPQIPTGTLEAHEATIKRNAEATDGRINWPGIAISKDYGTRTRR